MQKKAEENVSVSYTHLDVYKRQVRKHACAIVSSSMQVARDKDYISCNIAMKITAEVNRLKRAEEQQLMDTYLSLIHI